MSILGRLMSEAVMEPLKFAISPERRKLMSLLKACEDKKILLNIGCGNSDISQLPAGFQGYKEIRVDLDRSVNPDVVASFADLSAFPDASVDAIFNFHTIEHLYWFEVPKALAECRRVLRDDGLLAITCPDLQAAAAMIAEDRIEDVAYESSAGPITAFDLVFSYRPFVLRSPQMMSHKSGFTLRTLENAVRQAGFVSTFGFRRLTGFDLWLLATPQKINYPQLAEWAKRFLADEERGQVISSEPYRLPEGGKKVLHVGCGDFHPHKLPREEFPSEEWNEIRVDIDPAVQPDIVASITAMPAIPDQSCDGLFSSHNLEHLNGHEIPQALAEFWRVLKPGGKLPILVPDMQTVAAWVADDRLEETAYMSPAGPIRPHDMMYGLGSALAQGNLFMAHRCGFTASTLRQKLLAAGFAEVAVERLELRLELKATARR